MAYALKLPIYCVFFYGFIRLNRADILSDQAVEPEKAPIPSININNGAPVSIVIARPADVSKTSDADAAWFSGYALEYLVFRLDAINQFHVVYPDTSARSCRATALSLSRRLPIRRIFPRQKSSMHLLFFFRILKWIKRSKSLEFSCILQSVDNDDKRIECKASCDIDKSNEGDRSCIPS